MENKTILLIAAAGLVAFAFMGGIGGKQFYVPGVGYVPESELMNYGYQNVGGQWYSQSQVDGAVAQSGGSSGQNIDPGTQIFLDVMAILNSLIPLATTIGGMIVTAANRPQVIQEILVKQADANQPHFYANPQYSEVQLQQFTNDQLKSYLDYAVISGISGIHYTCSDAGRDLASGDPFGGKMLAHCRWGTNPQ